MIPRRLATLASIWLCGALLTPAPAQGVPDKDAEGRFDEMLAGAKRDPEKADWVALRHAFTETARYRPYNDRWKEEVAKIRSGLRGDDPKAAEAALDELLRREGEMRLDLHSMAAGHYARAGLADKAEFHEKFAQGLVHALFVSGDGKSFEEPLEVLYIDEEYALLRALRLKPKIQRMVAHEGHSFDVIEVAAEDGERSKFYFNIDRPWNWLQKSARAQGKAEK